MAKLKFDDIEEFSADTFSKKEKESISLGTVVEIPIEQIDIGENIRNVNEDDEAKLRQIGESILQDGQIEPCIVYQQGKRYILKAGSRRYKACVLCDVPFLKCIIDKKFENEKERIIYQATENEHRENMNPRERETYMSRLIELGMSQTEIAKALHKGKGWVSEALTAYNTLKDNPDLKDIIDEDTSTRDVWKLSKLEEEELNAVKQTVKEKGGGKKALKEELEKKSKSKPKAKTEKNENEFSNDEINEDFGIDFEIDEGKSETVTENKTSKKEENNKTFDEELDSFSGDFDITINEKNKRVIINIESFDKELCDFVKRQIENYYLNKGYTVD